MAEVQEQTKTVVRLTTNLIGRFRQAGRKWHPIYALKYTTSDLFDEGIVFVEAQVVMYKRLTWIAADELVIKEQ